MRRILPLTALAAVCLVSGVAGCGGDDDQTAGASTPAATVAVDGVLDVVPTTPATTTSTTTSTSTSTTSTSTTSTTTTTSTTISTTTAAPARTSLVATLAAIVEGAGDPQPPPTERVTDASGRLSLDVPIDWSERTTDPGRLADGAAAPYVAASPDMQGFLDGYDDAGMTVVVLPDEEALDAALESYRFEEDCRAGAARPYVGARLDGEYRAFRDCGGTDTDILTVVGEPDGDVGIVLLLAQIRELRDLAAVDTALESIAVRR